MEAIQGLLKAINVTVTLDRAWVINVGPVQRQHQYECSCPHERRRLAGASGRCHQRARCGD